MGSSRVRKKDRVSSSFRRIGSLQGIEEYELIKNGLRVLYVHDATAPVVGTMVTYLVGSRHEVAGFTGATHILEHLMFKGSKQFPPKKGKDILSTLSQKGSVVNASTFLDRTNYYEVFPKEHFDFVLQLEADRMRNARITQKDLQEELPAIKSEYAMSSGSDPVTILDEHVWATAFMAHPYHHPTIGWLSDIENITLERLQNFYDTYYHPNNAVVSIVGDVDRTYALHQVAKYFGVHKKAKHPFSHLHTQEPEQKGRRFVEVQRSGTKNVVMVAFKVPEALHEDTPALLTLASILGEGNTSRLYRALVEKGVASEAWSTYIPFYDPSLLVVTAVVHGNQSHEAVEKAILAECEKIVLKGIEKREYERVCGGLLTEMRLARDGHLGLLGTLNEAIAVGDWKMFFSLPKALQKVTEKHVQTVAKQYLSPNKMTVGYYRAIEK